MAARRYYGCTRHLRHVSLSGCLLPQVISNLKRVTLGVEPVPRGTLRVSPSGSPSRSPVISSKKMFRQDKLDAEEQEREEGAPPTSPVAKIAGNGAAIHPKTSVCSSCACLYLDVSLALPRVPVGDLVSGAVCAGSRLFVERAVRVVTVTPSLRETLRR